MPNKSGWLNLVVLLFIGSVMYNCESSAKKDNPFVAEMDTRTKTRFRQYMIVGKRLYQRECANCHGEDGEGLADLIPPLAKADYLMTHIDRTVCQIRHGIKGEIVVNGKTYNQEMPGNPNLRALEIAEIVTYITNSWGNERGLISAGNAEEFLRKCDQ